MNAQPKMASWDHWDALQPFDNRRPRGGVVPDDRNGFGLAEP